MNDDEMKRNDTKHSTFPTEVKHLDRLELQQLRINEGFGRLFSRTKEILLDADTLFVAYIYPMLQGFTVYDFEKVSHDLGSITKSQYFNLRLPCRTMIPTRYSCRVPFHVAVSVDQYVTCQSFLDLGIRSSYVFG